MLLKVAMPCLAVVANLFPDTEAAKPVWAGRNTIGLECDRHMQEDLPTTSYANN